MTTTHCDGVAFYEGFPSDFTKGKRVSTKIDGFFASSQTATLHDVKKAMAAYCKLNGGNTIIEFTYGQRALGFFASILSRDNIIWYGDGYIGVPSSL